MNGQRRASDPGLRDFYHDMNEHGGADYRKVGRRYVVELDTRPSGWAVTVWAAVEDAHRDGYAPPDGKEGNRYAWDAEGRETFEDHDEARAVVAGFGQSERKVREWCEAHPYDGPRSPYAERTA